MDDRFESFTFLIFKMTKLIQRIKNIEMKELGLKAVHVMCIYYLSKYPDGLTNKELCDLTLEDKAAISRALDVLKDKNLIDYLKKYNSKCKLTDLGIEASRYVLKKSSEALDRVSLDLTFDERNELYMALRKIEGNIEGYYNELIAGEDYEG